MKKIATGFISVAFLTAGALTTHAQFQLIDQWDFTAADSDLAPTEVDGTLNSGLAFDSDGGGQLTTGSALRISNDGGDANSGMDVSGLTQPVLRFEVEIAGWNFADPEDNTRRLSVGFVNTSNLFTANSSIRNRDPETDQHLTFRTEARGSDPAENSSTISGAPDMGWDLTRNTALTIRIDHDSTDPDNPTYAVYLDEHDGAGFTEFFSGLADPTRSPDRVRLGAFSGTGPTWEDSGTFIDVNSVAISAIPEPSTYAAIFGGIALLGAFFWRRRRS